MAESIDEEAVAAPPPPNVNLADVGQRLADAAFPLSHRVAQHKTEGKKVAARAR